MTTYCTFNCDYLKTAFSVIHNLAPINFQTNVPQFTFTHLLFSAKFFENLVWFRHQATFQILCSSGSQTLASIRISRGFITDCWIHLQSFWFKRKWIYISNKVLKWWRCCWSTLLLVNHYSTPKATNWKPSGRMRPTHMFCLCSF